jgi:hypothetical protein
MSLVRWFPLVPFVTVTILLVLVNTASGQVQKLLAFYVSSPVGSSRNLGTRSVGNGGGCRCPSNTYARRWMTMKVSRGRAKGAGLKGSSVTQVNLERITAAGRRGRKNFKDPNRVFVGNLPYTATEDDLRTFLESRGIPVNYMVQSIKVIRDWRTKESKGYAFLQFRTPIFATSALVSLNNPNSTLQGRILRFHQGQKKPDPTTVYVTKDSNTPTEDEDQELQVISSAIQYEKQEPFLQEHEEYDEEFWDVEDDEEEQDDVKNQAANATNNTLTAAIESNRAMRRKADRAMNRKRKKLFRGFGDL